jgi:hypothetical protein
MVEPSNRQAPPAPAIANTPWGFPPAPDRNAHQRSRMARQSGKRAFARVGDGRAPRRPATIERLREAKAANAGHRERAMSASPSIANARQRLAHARVARLSYGRTAERAQGHQRLAHGCLERWSIFGTADRGEGRQRLAQGLRRAQPLLLIVGVGRWATVRGRSATIWPAPASPLTGPLLRLDAPHARRPVVSLAWLHGRRLSAVQAPRPAGTWVEPRGRKNPRHAKPSNIIAQVDVSGTVVP